MNKKTYFFYSIILLFGYMSNYFDNSFIHPFLIYIIIFHILLHFIFESINKEINKKKSQSVMNFMFSVFIRFIFSLLFLSVLGIYSVINFEVLVLNFFLVYLLFIIFEIRILLTNFQPT